MAKEAQGWDRNAIAARAAQELRDGMYVNLGIGIPTPVANYIPRGMQVTHLATACQTDVRAQAADARAGKPKAWVKTMRCHTGPAVSQIPQRH